MFLHSFHHPVATREVQIGHRDDGCTRQVFVKQNPLSTATQSGDPYTDCLIGWRGTSASQHATGNYIRHRHGGGTSYQEVTS